MIAKTILDFFTLLPGASRSSVQSSEEPLQAFSDSLLVATKSFSQSGNTDSAGSKTVRGQSTATVGAKAPVAVLDDSDDPLAGAPQPSRGSSIDLSSPPAPPADLTASDSTSTGNTATTNQTQPAVDPAESRSIAAQTGNAQSKVFFARLARAAGFQSRFAGVKTQRIGSSSQIVSTGVATKPFRNVTVTRLANSQSTPVLTGGAGQDAVQQAMIAAQTAPAQPATQIAATGAEISIDRDYASTVPAETRSAVIAAGVPQTIGLHQAVIPTNTMAVQTNAAQPMSARASSTAAASRPVLNVPTARWSRAESSIDSVVAEAPADVAANGIHQTTGSASIADAAQVSVDRPEAARPAAPTANSAATGNAAFTVLRQGHSTDDAKASASQPFVTPSSFDSVRMPVGTLSTTEMVSRAVTGQDSQIAPSSEGTEARTDVATTNIASPETEDASTMASGTSARNLTTASLFGNQPANPHVQVSQPAAVQWNITSTQTPATVPDSAQLPVTGVIEQESPQAPPTSGRNETKSSATATEAAPVARFDTVPQQSAIASSEFSGENAAFDQPATVQSGSTVTASQPAWIASSYGWNGPQESAARTSIPNSTLQPAATKTHVISEPADAPASISRPAALQFSMIDSSLTSMTNVSSNDILHSAVSVSTFASTPTSVASAPTYVADPAPTLNAQPVEVNQTVQDAPELQRSEAGLSGIEDKSSQFAGVQSTSTQAQRSAIWPSGTLETRFAVASQSVVNVQAAESAAPHSIVAPVGASPADIQAPVILQSAASQTDVPALQAPVVQQAEDQQTSIGVANPAAWSVPAARWSETETAFNSASTSEPTAPQLNAVPLQNETVAPAVSQNTSSVRVFEPVQNLPAAKSAPDGVTSQQARNVASNVSMETQFTIQRTGVAPAIVTQASPVESTFTSVRGSAPDSTAPIPVAATIPQPEENASDVQRIETGAKISQASSSQLVAVQSSESSVETPDASPVTTHDYSAEVSSSQAAQLTPTAAWSNTERYAGPTNIAPSKIAETKIAQPVAVESSVAPMERPVDRNMQAQGALKAVASQPLFSAKVTSPAESQPKSSQTEISLASAVEPSTAPVQTSFFDATTTLMAPAVTDHHTAQDLAMAEGGGNRSGIAATNIVPIETVQPATAKITVNDETLQLAAKVTPVEFSKAEATNFTAEAAQPELPANPVPSAQPAEAQFSAHVEISQLARNVESPQLAEAETSVSETPKTIIEAAPVQSEVKRQGIGTHQTPSQLPGTLTVETTTSSAVTPASGDASATSVIATPGAAPVSVSAKTGDPVTSSISLASNAAPDASSVAENSETRDMHSSVAENASSNAAQSATANEPAAWDQVQVLRAVSVASVRDAVAPASKTDSAVETSSLPPAAVQVSTVAAIAVPAGAADHASLLPLPAEAIEKTEIKNSSLKPIASAKSISNAPGMAKSSGTDQSGTKKTPEPASASASKNNSRDAATSGDQNQGSSAPQMQATTAVPVSFTIHPAAVIAAAQNAAPGTSIHGSSTAADPAGIAAQTPEAATAHVSIALPQTAPVINTARLIQSMGQSEMRVGMRSNEFGSISISTTTTARDQVSAQISLEHGELARTLVAHLPEMQARLGGNQTFDVRIDMNSAATGQGTSNFGGTSNDTAGQSRGGRQQGGNLVASQSDTRVAEQQFSPVVAAVPSGYARLDIRV